MHKLIGFLVAGLLLTLPASVSTAATILQNIINGGSGGGGFFLGESLTTPTGGPWNTITFNFYAFPITSLTPVAPGTAFLLNQVYSGLPGNLSTSTPGFLAQSTGSAGGVYSFSSGVTLLPNQTYYLLKTVSYRPPLGPSLEPARGRCTQHNQVLLRSLTSV